MTNKLFFRIGLLLVCVLAVLFDQTWLNGGATVPISLAMLFPAIDDLIVKSDLSALALGKTVKVPITREFALDSIGIRVTGTVTTGAATMNADAIFALLKRVTLTVNGKNYINGVSGPRLIEFTAAFQGLDDQTIAVIGNNTTGAKEFTAWIWLGHPQLKDPIRPLLMPRPINEDGTLEIVLANQSDIDVNATPTYAATGGFTIEIILRRRPVDLALLGHPHIESEMNEYDQPWAASGTRQFFELPALGSYTSVTLANYTSASARGDISSAAGVISLELANAIIRKNYPRHIAIINELSKGSGAAGKFLNSYMFDFLADTDEDVLEVSSLLDANPASTQGSRFRVFQDVTGGANVRTKFLTHRLYGDLSRLKALAVAKV